MELLCHTPRLATNKKYRFHALSSVMFFLDKGEIYVFIFVNQRLIKCFERKPHAYCLPHAPEGNFQRAMRLLIEHIPGVIVVRRC